MKIAVVGGLGKLGSSIVEILKNQYEIFAIDTKCKNQDFDAKNFDLVVDASSHTNTPLLAKKCAQTCVPLLVCATGHTSDELHEIEKYMTSTTIKFCPNLSYGINVIACLLGEAKFENARVSIFERHHTSKKDAPSGTAIMLGELCKKFAKSVEIVSSRFGDDVGTHSITIDTNEEQIIICHHAKSRKAFAIGAKYHIEKILKEHYEKYKN